MKKIETKKKLIAICITLILLIGFSYAWLTLTIDKTQTNVIRAGKLDLILDESTTEGIHLEKAVPMSEEKGMTLEPYTFKLKNNGSTSLRYKIYLDDEESEDIKMENKNVRISLIKNQIPVSNNLLSKLKNNSSRIIDTGIITGNETSEYQLRAWIDQEATNEVSGTVFYGKLRVEAEQANVSPEKVTVSMPENTQTERNFTWHMKEDGYSSDVQIIKATDTDKNNANFTDSSNILEFTGSVLTQEFNYYVHQTKATGLEKGTKYYYRVGDKSKNCWSSTGEFITDNGDDEFSFIYVADQQTSAAEAPKATYTIQQAKQISKNAEFLLNAGDFVNEPLSAEEWKASLNFTAYGDTTTIATAGNHEYYIWNGYHNHALRNHFYYDFETQNTEGGIYYSLNYGNVHIAVLNTNSNFYSTIDSTQLAWLKQDLSSEAAQNAKFKLVLMHRGVYTTGPHYYYHQDIQPLTNQLTSVMADYGVDLVFQGHDHVYALTYPIDAQGQAQNINYTDVYSSETEQTVKSMTNNTAPVYFIGDAVGPKHEANLIKEGDTYVVDPTAGKSYTNQLTTAQIDTYFSKFQVRETPKDENNVRYGVFSSVTVKGGNLIVNSYNVDNQNYGKVNLYNSFALSK